MVSKTRLLLKTLEVAGLKSVNLNCLSPATTKKNKTIYRQTYPTTLQFPDGSTINIQYHEPIDLIKLPLDLTTLTEAERKARLFKRIPRTKITIQEEIEDEFDETRYLKKK